MGKAFAYRSTRSIAAEQAQAFRLLFEAFGNMLGLGPGDSLRVSSSLRHDRIPGHGPAGYQQGRDLIHDTPDRHRAGPA